MSNLHGTLSRILNDNPFTSGALGFYVLDRDRRQGDFMVFPHQTLEDTSQSFLDMMYRAQAVDADLQVLMRQRILQLAQRRLYQPGIDDREFFCSQVAVLAYGILFIEQNHDRDRVLGCRYIGVTYSLKPSESLELFFHTEAFEFIAHVVQVVEKGAVSLPELDTVPTLNPATRH